MTHYFRLDGPLPQPTIREIPWASQVSYPAFHQPPHGVNSRDAVDDTFRDQLPSTCTEVLPKPDQAAEETSEDSRPPWAETSSLHGYLEGQDSRGVRFRSSSGPANRITDPGLLQQGFRSSKLLMETSGETEPLDPGEFIALSICTPSPSQAAVNDNL